MNGQSRIFRPEPKIQDDAVNEAYQALSKLEMQLRPTRIATDKKDPDWRHIGLPTLAMSQRIHTRSFEVTMHQLTCVTGLRKRDVCCFEFTLKCPPTLGSPQKTLVCNENIWALCTTSNEVSAAHALDPSMPYVF